MRARDWSNPVFGILSSLIATRTGLATAPHRRPYVESCIQQAMSRAGIRNLNDYVRLLNENGRALDELVDEITIQESYFFRDPRQLDFIRDTILPEWRMDGRFHRVWSAGCAAGEEAYSLAIMLEQEHLAETTSVIGTDISRRALAKGREGRYTSWALRASTPDFINRYFEPGLSDRRIAARFRQRVSFDHLNLVSPFYPANVVTLDSISLILCRNVFIYFDAETIADIARRFLACLVPGGWLITGPSDPLLPEIGGLTRVITNAGVVYRRVQEIVAFPEATPAVPVLPPLAGNVFRPSFTQRTRPRPVIVRPVAIPEADRAEAAPDDRGEAARIRALADAGRMAEAGQAAAEAAARRPLSAEIHFVHSLILLDTGRVADALGAIRRVLYLDRNLAMAHWLHGTILEHLGTSGDTAESRAALRRSLALLRDRPGDEIIPLSDGEKTDGFRAALSTRIAAWDLEGSMTP